MWGIIVKFIYTYIISKVISLVIRLLEYISKKVGGVAGKALQLLVKLLKFLFGRKPKGLFGQRK